MQYQILATENFMYLQDLVNEYLANGWKCQGGVSSIVRNEELYFIQAVVREA